jgi:pyruvate dehydrogenase E2 component (dihydrolipoamide acetyltransferase)
MEEGIIAKWHKKVGDHVEPGEVLLDVSTDKATVEHQALDGGWLRQLLVQEGGEATVNQPIAIFTEEKDEKVEGYQPEGETRAEKAPAAVEAEKPKPQPAPQKKPPEPAPVGNSKKSAPKTSPAPINGTEEKQRILASPLARKLAENQNIDLSGVQGTGPGGRIMQRDLANASSVSGDVSTGSENGGAYASHALSPIRKIIAQRLQEAKNTIPHFYIQQTIDAGGLVGMRSELKHGGVALTINDLIIKAVALALKEHPGVNAGFDPKMMSIMRFKNIDISVAVSLEEGLITPIIKEADKKSLNEISAEVKQLSARAKEGKLKPEEFQGGGFTISNLGMYGITNFHAIINPPQAAILAVSGIMETPIVKNGQVVPGQTMNLNLSVDHRVIDGVAAAKFIKTLQRLLEKPVTILVA